MTRTLLMAAALAAVIAVSGCGGGASAPASAAADPRPGATQASTVVRPTVLAVRGHDRTAFTQGLVWWRGRMFESTGLYGASQVREIHPRTGRPLRSRPLGDGYFGEGLALYRDRLIQLTWRERTGFVWDRDTLRPLRALGYRGEGWGLATDGDRLVMSDGTATLRFLDPRTLRQTGQLRVTDAGRRVPGLNELEMVDGLLWANVYSTEEIVVIDLATGRVRVRLDMAHLVDRLPTGREIDVLNGIAWERSTGRVIVTGKLWPRMFVVAVPPEARG